MSAGALAEACGVSVRTVYRDIEALMGVTISEDKPGVYRGQCAELCGIDHAEMFFNVEVMSREDFDKWVRPEDMVGPK